MADIKYTVMIDASTCAAEIKKLEGEIDKLAKTTKTGGEEAAVSQPKWMEFAKGVAAGFFSVQALEGAGRKLIGFFKDSVTAAAEAETAENNLKNALFTTGRTIQDNFRHYQGYADAIMKVTKYDDEQIKKTQALLLQMTTLNREGIDRATRGAIGLASVLGIDLNSATMLVTKAMEGNYEVLSRYGIKVKEGTTETEKQTYILGRLDTMYQRATREVDTFAGAQAQLKNTIGELKETIGGFIIESETYRKSISHLKQVTEDLNVIAKAHDKTILDKTANIVKNYTALRALVEIEKAFTGEIHRQAEAVRYNQELAEKYLPQYKAIDQWLLKQGIDLAALTGLWERNTESNERGNRAMGEFNETIKLSAKAFTAAGTAAKYFAYIASPALVETESKARHMGMVMAQAVEQMSEGLGYIKKAWVDNIRIMALEWDEQMEKIKDIAFRFTSQFDAISQQRFMNESIRIDNEEKLKTAALDREYLKKENAIKNSLMSEEEKNKALAALEEKKNKDMAGIENEIEKKRTEAKRSAAQTDKSIALVEAIMNTAAAVTKSLTGAVFPLNVILAAATAALGAVQISLIKNQPLPLQAGAYTMGAGLAYLHPGEIVAPKPIMKETFREVIHERRSSKTIHLHQNIYVGGQKIKEVVTEIVERTSREGTLKIAAKAIR